MTDYRGLASKTEPFSPPIMDVKACVCEAEPAQGHHKDYFPGAQTVKMAEANEARKANTFSLQGLAGKDRDFINGTRSLL